MSPEVSDGWCAKFPRLHGDFRRRLHRVGCLHLQTGGSARSKFGWAQSMTGREAPSTTEQEVPSMTEREVPSTTEREVPSTTGAMRMGRTT